MTAAQVWYLVACSHMRSRGEAPSISAVARVVGDSHQQVGRYVRGEVDATSGKLASWGEAWVEAGYPPVEIALGAEGWAPVGAT